MALTDRERGRLTHVLETVLRADDTVMDIADDRATRGSTPEDKDLDALHEALTEAVSRIQRLLGVG